MYRFSKNLKTKFFFLYISFSALEAREKFANPEKFVLFLLDDVTYIKKKKIISYYDIKPLFNEGGFLIKSKGYVWPSNILYERIEEKISKKEISSQIRIDDIESAESSKAHLKKTMLFSSTLESANNLGKLLTLIPLQDKKEDPTAPSLEILLLPQQKDNKSFWVSDDWHYFPYTKEQIEHFSYLQKTAELLNALKRKNKCFIFFSDLCSSQTLLFDLKNPKKIEQKIYMRKLMITLPFEPNSDIKNIKALEYPELLSHDFFFIFKEGKRLDKNKKYYQVLKIYPQVYHTFYHLKLFGLDLMKQAIKICQQKEQNLELLISIKDSEDKIKFKDKSVFSFSNDQKAYKIKCLFLYREEKKKEEKKAYILLMPKNMKIFNFRRRKNEQSKFTTMSYIENQHVSTI